MTDMASRSTWDGTWVPSRISIDTLAELRAGITITVAKWAPDGSEVTRYPATVVETTAPSPWVELVADWTLPRVEVAGLVFETGDTLREFYSAEHSFNAFAVISPEGELRGWYGNVTYPAFVDEGEGDPVLVWHDLYLDVVILPDGTMHLLDDDELAESGLPSTQPDFAKAIVQARRDLINIIPTLIPSSIPGGEQTVRSSRRD